MNYNWLYVVSFLSVALQVLCLLTPRHSPYWDNMRLKHAWKAVPTNWEALGHPPPDTMINLYLALKPRHENALIDALNEVSDPKHPKHASSATLLRINVLTYGAHLSKEQAAELVAPHPDTLQLIDSWLEHYGIPSSSVSPSHGGGWLMLTGVPVSQANALLGASYQLYEHAETKDRIIRTLGYALPVVLHAHVQAVAPTNYFGSPRKNQRRPREHSGEETSRDPGKALSNRLVQVTPPLLQWMYGTSTYMPAATDRNVLAIAGYYGDYPSNVDLMTFMNEYRSDGLHAAYTLVPLGTGVWPVGPSEEANADIQYTQSISFPTPHVYYSTLANEEGLLIWLNYVLTRAIVPQTITTSYCGPEQDFSEDYATRLCFLFAQLGARGASVLFSSGDTAVGGGNCQANDGSGRVQFLPMFPPSCPFVTSVGGTIDHSPEAAVAFSSGGFSNYFRRQPYQDEAVAGYLQYLGNQYAGLYNVSSRAFPDISAQAYKFRYIFNGQHMYFYGTSCSSPAAAAVISLYNDYRISHGIPALGFLNPWLYGGGYAGFNDIKSGSNPGCGTRGFSAIAGWDPITGFGTPNLTKLVDVPY
ncbi:subtilisin-like protein [Lactarius quietus]|nr:subtilisin-like protein [Lactarius quietus]